MASRNGGGGGGGGEQDPIVLSSDSESDSYAGSGLPEEIEGGICEFRSARYHDQECERYFDCPTHLVERDGEDVEMSNAEDDPREDEEEEMSDAEDDEGEEMSEDSEGEREQEEVPELPATPRRGDPGRTAANPIVLESSPVAPRVVDVSLGPARREAPVAGPSGLRTQGQSAGPELVLPRWQPDAEVTYCPICHTQFSIWVRKHHCRYVGMVLRGAYVGER